MPSGATWVSRVPEFGGEGGEQPDASHMDSGGMEEAPTVDADGLSSERAGRSSSGVDSTPNAGFPQGPAESAEPTREYANGDELMGAKLSLLRFIAFCCIVLLFCFFCYFSENEHLPKMTAVLWFNANKHRRYIHLKVNF